MSGEENRGVTSATSEVDLNARRESENDPPDSNRIAEVDLPIKALTHGLLEKCPPGSLPTCIKKQILIGGRNGSTAPPYPNKTRIRFHSKTSSLEDGVTYDDTRKNPKPMEIILGKKFKMEVWELALNTMFEGEVSKFLVPMELCIYYPMVAKVFREAAHKKEGCSSSRSCCGSLLSGTGHSDLDDLLKRPRSLSFVFELIDVSLPGEYEMESWYMTDDEKSVSISTLQDEGNRLFWNRHYKDAALKYMEGVNRVEQLMNKEVPGSQEMKDLQEKKVPLLLNYAFCKQKNREYYEALRFNNLALDIDRDNVKGLFRRGQCQKQLANFVEAREDLTRALELDSTLKKVVNAEFEEIDVLEKGAVEAERIRCQKMFRKHH